LIISLILSSTIACSNIQSTSTIPTQTHHVHTYKKKKAQDVNNIKSPKVNNYSNSVDLLRDFKIYNTTNISAKKDDNNDQTWTKETVLATMSFVFSLFTLFWTEFKEKKNKIIDYKENFWLKQTLFPPFIQSITSLVKESSDALVKLNFNSTKFMTEYFIPKKNQIEDISRLFISHSKSFEPAVYKILTDLDDELSDSINNGILIGSDVTNAINKAYILFVAELDRVIDSSKTK